jgi:acetolactate synthase-1/2/3 large subunit
MGVGDIIVDALYNIGVRNVFGVPGHQTLPYYDALYRKNEIKHILFHHEYAAGFAADAYSRITNKIGVVDGTYGVGLLYLMPSIAEAYNASIPLLIITGDTDLDIMFTKYQRGNVSQGVDQISLAKSVTKAQFVLTDVNKINEVLRNAITTALSGRPGPVIIDIPSNIFWSRLSEDVIKRFSAETQLFSRYRKYPLFRIQPEPQRLEDCISLLTKSKRPIILVGGGIHISMAWGELYDFATKLNIPVISTLTGKGSFPEDHILYLGVVGSLGYWNSANMALEKADLVIAIGTKLGQYATNNWTSLREKSIIRIDVDPMEFERGFYETLSLYGDAKIVLSECLRLINNKHINFSFAWSLSELKELRDGWLSNVFKLQDKIFIKAMIELSRIITEKDIVVTDASSSSGNAAAFLQLKGNSNKRRFITPRGAAGLGYGVPGGIGAAIGCVEEFNDCNKIIVIAGDGGFNYVVSELETIVRLNLPIMIIILNDQALGWIKREQEVLLSGHVISTEFNQIDYVKLGESFGMITYETKVSENLNVTLNDAYKQKEPVLISIRGSTYVPFKGLD